MEDLNLLRLAAIARFMRPSPKGNLASRTWRFGERPRLDLLSTGFEDEVTVAAGERPEFLDNQRVPVEVAPGPRGAVRQSQTRCYYLLAGIEKYPML